MEVSVVPEICILGCEILIFLNEQYAGVQEHATLFLT